jgi:Zn-dependent protease with chaperone function
MAEQKPGKLLNPFAFPSETQLRSILLIWAILGLCWSVGFYFANVFASSVGWPAIDKLPKINFNILYHEEERPSDGAFLDHVREQLEHTLAGYKELETPGRLARMQADLAGLSEAAHFQLKAMVPYFVIPVIFLVCALLCILVLYIIRARRLRLSGRAPSRVEEKPELQRALQTLIGEVQELQRQHGERPIPQPRILLSRGAVGDGQAFGSSRRPVILLTRAMPSILRKEIRQHGGPYSFRAAVLHELAHLANRDVTRSYWAEASWIILVPVLTLLIVTLWMFRSSLAVPDWFQAGIHMISILLVVELIRRGILRGREHEADLRTALLWNAGEPLRSSLAEDESDLSSPGALRKQLSRLWRRHPTTAERRDVLDYPNRALVLGMDVPFLAGLLFGNLIVSILVLTSVIVLTLQALAALMTNSIIEGLVRSHGPAMAMRLYYPVGFCLWFGMIFVATFGVLCAGSYLLAGTLGVQAQRESVLQIVEADRHPRPYWTLLKPAFFAAAGFEIGLVLVPMTPALPGQVWGFLGLIAWVLFATLPFWGWLSATRLFARRLLGTHLAFRKPVRQLRIVKWASTILLWPLILILLGGQFWIWPSMRSVQVKAALAMGLLGLLGFIFLLALMLFPLAVREVRREERRPRCPHCGSEVYLTSVAGDCPTCGNSLAPWLCIDEVPSALEAGAA